MQEGYERYGDVWLLSMQRGTSFVLVSEPDLVKQVFTADPAVLRGGEANAQIGTALMGKHSVILLDEDDHTAARNLLLPPFHRDSIQRFSDHVARACEKNLASWPLHTRIELLPVCRRSPSTRSWQRYSASPAPQSSACARGSPTWWRSAPTSGGWC